MFRTYSVLLFILAFAAGAAAQSGSSTISGIVRDEAYNVFNRANFSIPGYTVGAADFGVISSAHTAAGREVQFLGSGLWALGSGFGTWR